MSADPKDGANAFSPEARWRVLEAAAASSNLKRAARLREFLLYIGRKSIIEGSSDFHEQKIGQEVFGRKESYDTGQDNIVRVSATELRKRVDAYFAIEGKDEPLIFEIPRGSYAPVFRLRAAETQPSGQAAQVDTSSPDLASTLAALRRAKVALVLLSAISVVLAIACAVLWWQIRTSH
jgi:hypothetical protein